MKIKRTPCGCHKVGNGGTPAKENNKKTENKKKGTGKALPSSSSSMRTTSDGRTAPVYCPDGTLAKVVYVVKDNTGSSTIHTTPPLNDADALIRLSEYFANRSESYDVTKQWHCGTNLVAESDDFFIEECSVPLCSPNTPYYNPITQTCCPNGGVYNELTQSCLSLSGCPPQQWNPTLGECCPEGEYYNYTDRACRSTNGCPLIQVNLVTGECCLEYYNMFFETCDELNGCLPQQWNPVTQTCCPAGTLFSYVTQRCVTTSCSIQQWNFVAGTCCPNGQYFNLSTLDCRNTGGCPLWQINLFSGECCPEGAYSPFLEECLNINNCPLPMLNLVTGECCPAGQYFSWSSGGCEDIPNGCSLQQINPQTGECCETFFNWELLQCDGDNSEGDCNCPLNCPLIQVNPLTGECCPTGTVFSWSNGGGCIGLPPNCHISQINLLTGTCCPTGQYFSLSEMACVDLPPNCHISQINPITGVCCEDNVFCWSNVGTPTGCVALPTNCTLDDWNPLECACSNPCCTFNFVSLNTYNIEIGSNTGVFNGIGIVWEISQPCDNITSIDVLASLGLTGLVVQQAEGVTQSGNYWGAIELYTECPDAAGESLTLNVNATGCPASVPYSIPLCDTTDDTQENYGCQYGLAISQISQTMYGVSTDGAVVNYAWSVTDATIVSGQGTSEIVTDTRPTSVIVVVTFDDETTCAIAIAQTCPAGSEMPNGGCCRNGYYDLSLGGCVDNPVDPCPNSGCIETDVTVTAAAGQGSQIVYTAVLSNPAAAALGINYTWIISGAAVILNGQNTNTITVAPLSDDFTIDLIVTIANCGERSIRVHTPPPPSDLAAPVLLLSASWCHDTQNIRGVIDQSCTASVIVTHEIRKISDNSLIWSGSLDLVNGTAFPALPVGVNIVSDAGLPAPYPAFVPPVVEYGFILKFDPAFLQANGSVWSKPILLVDGCSQQGLYPTATLIIGSTAEEAYIGSIAVMDNNDWCFNTPIYPALPPPVTNLVIDNQEGIGHQVVLKAGNMLSVSPTHFSIIGSTAPGGLTALSVQTWIKKADGSVVAQNSGTLPAAALGSSSSAADFVISDFTTQPAGLYYIETYLQTSYGSMIKFIGDWFEWTGTSVVLGTGSGTYTSTPSGANLSLSFPPNRPQILGNVANNLLQPLVNGGLSMPPANIAAPPFVVTNINNFILGDNVLSIRWEYNSPVYGLLTSIKEQTVHAI